MTHLDLNPTCPPQSQPQPKPTQLLSTPADLNPGQNSPTLILTLAKTHLATKMTTTHLVFPISTQKKPRMPTQKKKERERKKGEGREREREKERSNKKLSFF